MLTSQLNLQTTATFETQYILGTTAGGNAINNTSSSVLLASLSGALLRHVIQLRRADRRVFTMECDDKGTTNGD